MRTVLALAALLACLAGVPAHGQPTPPAPGATPPPSHCVGCDALRVTLDAYRIVHRQLEEAISQRTRRMDELAASALDATPLTPAERAEVKQLDEALRNLVQARDAWKDLIDDLQKAIDDCAKQCAAPVAAEGAGRVGQGGTPSIPMPKAACPQCQGFAQALFMLQVAKADVDKRLQERRAELSAASAQAAGGQQTREQYQRVQAMRKEVDLLAGAARSLQWDTERMEAALRNCNRRCPGGEGYSDWEHLALAGLSLFDQPEEDDRYTPVPPERRGKALCPECIPAQQAVEAARDALQKARERRERLQDEMRPPNDQLNDLRWRRYAAETELEQIRSGLSKEPNPQARAAELRTQLDNLDAPIRDLNRKIRPLREAIREIEQELPGLRRAVEDAELALIRCNRERCKTAVQVDTVVGVTGTNPFNPDNPTGTTGGTQPPPPPQGPGTLQFSASGYSGGEGGAVLVIVTRGGGQPGRRERAVRHRLRKRHARQRFPAGQRHAQLGRWRHEPEVLLHPAASRQPGRGAGDLPGEPREPHGRRHPGRAGERDHHHRRRGFARANRQRAVLGVFLCHGRGPGHRHDHRHAHGRRGRAGGGAVLHGPGERHGGRRLHGDQRDAHVGRG